MSTTLARPRTFCLDTNDGPVTCTSDLSMQAAAELLKGSRSDFACDLSRKVIGGQRLSPKQELWIVYLAQQALDAKNAPAKSVAPGEFIGLIQSIRNLQEGRATGRVVLRVKGARLSAVTSGQNVGCIYVKDENGAYLGKITPQGHFRPVYGGLDPEQEAAVLDAMRAAAADPQGAAAEYGRETGRCACCGRELTNPESIALGIGPICLETLIGG